MRLRLFFFVVTPAWPAIDCQMPGDAVSIYIMRLVCLDAQLRLCTGARELPLCVLNHKLQAFLFALSRSFVVWPGCMQGAWLQHFGRCNDNTKIFASSILTLKPLLHKKCISLPPPPTVFLAALQMQCKNIAVCHCSGKCCGVRHYKGWARQGRFAIEHCRDTVGLGTSGMLCGWALQGYSEVGHCRDTLRFCRDTCFLGTAGIHCSRALQGYFAIELCRGIWWLDVAGYCRDTHRLGTAGILCGWALRGCSAVGHCRDTLRLGIAGILCGSAGIHVSWALPG